MKRLKIIGAFILILAMSGPSCQKFNLNTDDLDIKLDLNIIKTTLTVQFRNSATGELIGSNDASQVNVTILGDDSQWVVNNSGNSVTMVQSAGGYLSIGLDPYNAKPTAEDPVRITLSAETPGYVSTTAPLTITEEGPHELLVDMVNTMAPPDGVIVSENQDAGTSEDGKLTEEIKVDTGTDSVQITLAAGTEIRDASGNPMEGKLDVTIVQFDPTEDGAVKSFPGGLTVDVVGESGGQQSGSFVSAGFFKIDITDDKGNQAAGFSGGALDLKAAINPKVINPTTGRAVQSGDAVPLWNLNEKTGRWKFVKNMIVGLDPLMLKSLKTSDEGSGSWYNLGWLENSCQGTLVFNLGGLTPGNGSPEAVFRIQMRSPDGTLERELDITIPASGIVGFTGLQSGSHTISFSYTGIGTSPWIVPSTITHDFCNDGSSVDNIPLLLTPNDPGLTITFNVTIYCTDQGASATIPDGILLHFREKGTTDWGTVTANGGTVSISGLVLNKTYEVQALYNGDWTPAPPFEYTLVEDPANPNVRSLLFELVCGG